MKKVIGIFGFAVIAATLAFNTNISGVDSNLQLADLIAINTADAECPSGSVGVCRLEVGGGSTCVYDSSDSNKVCGS
ncbi:hypothetical protein KO529_01495 [Arenibacter algicola]|uniref:hypothetical protein n=1 Tax=Arenibacter algicola TaxID=616991 RepID=UPI001C072E56|nr:hypothetical protein [Arenibacter algicola]MBU2903443.1 hypothetical protein [Arenibacter algicola]